MNQEAFRILLIDSSEERFNALSSVLKESGYRDIVTCDPTPVTVNCVAELNPHIVLIDVECPSRDTMEQLSLIRDNCPKPVILLSQDENIQGIEAAIQSGVSAYLTEGIVPSQARPVIEAAMATFAAGAFPGSADGRFEFASPAFDAAFLLLMDAVDAVDARLPQVALVTPMAPDGAVDLPKLREILQWHKAEGTAAPPRVGRPPRRGRGVVRTHVRGKGRIGNLGFQ